MNAGPKICVCVYKKWGKQKKGGWGGVKVWEDSGFCLFFYGSNEKMARILCMREYFFNEKLSSYKFEIKSL